MLGGSDEETLMASAKAIADAYKAPAAPMLKETGNAPASKGASDQRVEFMNQLLGKK